LYVRSLLTESAGRKTVEEKVLRGKGSGLEVIPWQK